MSKRTDYNHLIKGATVSIQPFAKTKKVKYLEAFYKQGDNWYSVKTGKRVKKSW